MLVIVALVVRESTVGDSDDGVELTEQTDISSSAVMLTCVSVM